MSFALPEEARAWRDKLSVFVEKELKPFELEAEMNEGRIPPRPRSATSVLPLNWGCRAPMCRDRTAGSNFRS
jgi:hypothetical protein